IEDYMVSVGASFVERDRLVRLTGPTGKEAVVTSAVFGLDTNLGFLTVTPFGKWIACRWDEPERAKTFINTGRLNPYSGKWNFHFTSDYTAGVALHDFKRELTPWLKKGDGRGSFSRWRVYCKETGDFLGIVVGDAEGALQDAQQ